MFKKKRCNAHSNIISLVHICAISTELTIQKQPATCDLTKDLTKLGYSGSRFDRSSSPRITADDLAPPCPSNVALPFLKLQVKHRNSIVIKYINKSQTAKLQSLEVHQKHLRCLTDLTNFSV